MREVNELEADDERLDFISGLALNISTDTGGNWIIEVILAKSRKCIGIGKTLRQAIDKARKEQA